MGTATMYATQSARISILEPNTNYSNDTVVSDDNLLVSFSGFPTEAQYKKISLAKIFLYATLISGSAQSISDSPIEFLAETFDEKVVTYGTSPKISTWDARIYDYVSAAKYIYATVSGITLNGIHELLRNGIHVIPPYRIGFQTSRGENKPYVTVEYSDDLIGIDLDAFSPASGTIVAAAQTTFTWGEKNSGICYADVSRTSATFRWRGSESDTIRSIPVTTGATSITIPANTFPGESIQWQISVTANSGVTTTSDWMTLSLADMESMATIKSPKGEVIDASGPVVFSWSHIISTGTDQTKAELQISTDMQTWTALATVTGAETTYTAPANTLGSGTKYWRVRTYNTDNAAGAWSDAAEFICVGAPAAPAVSIKSQSPRPVIGWQSSEQLAYQVEIDGVYSSGTYYGTEKTWTAPMYLEDGKYIVRVRVQNEYAMWSPWGSAALQVANTAGPAINLTAEAGDAVRISWRAAGGYHYNFYLIYRNGKLIAKTQELTYTDLRSIGSVSYQVRGCFDTSSNYRLSNAVTVTVSVPCVTLIDLDTGDVLPLPYSASTHRTTGRNLSRGVQSVQLAGRRYPTIERSMHYAETISVACAFRDAEGCAALEALVGKMVAVKTPEGKMVSGCLSVLAATADGGFYTTYQFDVEQADVEEVVEIDS